MNAIESQVRRARRRIVLASFGRALSVTLFIALVIATCAVGAAAIWVIEMPLESWATYWVAGAAGVAVFVAAAFAMLTAPSQASVATELDKRFGLRERLSSSLLMDPAERETPFGKALVEDADRRAKQLTVADKFALRAGRLGWLPVTVVPVLALVMWFVEPAQKLNASSKGVDAAELDQIKTATEQLKRRIQAQRRKAESEGLEEAEDLFRKMEADLDKIALRKDVDKKEAMIAMNDLKKEIEKRREQLGSPDQVQRALSQMKGIETGPAEQVAKSIEKGEFGKAQELVKDLAKKLRDGKLSDVEKQQLQQQVKQMRDQLEQAAQEHEQKKQELKDQIEKARSEGRGEDAAKMQQQLNGLESQDAQMEKVKQMAKSMKQAAEAMEQGDMQEAAEALEEMGDQLSEMQQEMSEMEEMQSALDELSQSKNQMRCQGCGGAGCEKCRGGNKNADDGKGGRDWGRGRGSGTGPETDLDANTYDTQVRGDVKPGQAIKSGEAEGPNRKGISQEEIKQAVESVLSKESDPLENQLLPRDEREQAEQYFNQLREGK